MLNKAIEKIKNEMDKNNNPYVKVVGEFLLKHLEVNPGAAEKILIEDKTIIKSLDEMRRAAEKKKVGNCAVLTDQEGFEIVSRYFGIEDKLPKIEPITVTPKVIEEPVKDEIDFNVKLEDFLI